MVASSAARTVVLLTSTRASSSLTSAVSANRDSILFALSFVVAELGRGVIRDRGRGVLTLTATPGMLADRVGELPGDGDGAVLAARAADGDGRVALVLTLVAGEHGLEGRGVGVDEFVARRPGRARSR